jgi:uncharacterized protein with FMN-binding domain/NAD-dependent dihydropyrimidine dehydrogenase PreA subunit
MMKPNRKITAFKIMRRLIQLAAFIFLPGLFISVFSAIKDVFAAAVHSNFNFNALSYQLLILAAVIPVTVLAGRFFCGYLCAFGSMGDFLWFISRIIHKKNIKINEKADKALKLFKYLLLIFLIIFVWAFGIISFKNTMSPWTIFGMYATVSGWPTAAYLLTIGAVLLLVIIIGSVFIERFFCRYCCPLGAVFAVISRVRLIRIKKPRISCGACTICTDNCPMGIPLYKSDVITSGECIDCFNCVFVCPRKNIKANLAPPVAAACAAVSIAGLYYLGNLTLQTPNVTAGTVVSTAQATPVGPYQDGTFTGSAAGFRGFIKVKVTVKNGYIEAISITSSADDQEYFSRAKDSVISNILLSQSTGVSAVSGATFSSEGIINAVKNALVLTQNDTTAADRGITVSPSPSADSSNDSAVILSSTSPETSTIQPPASAAGQTSGSSPSTLPAAIVSPKPGSSTVPSPSPSLPSKTTPSSTPSSTPSVLPSAVPSVSPTAAPSEEQTEQGKFTDGVYTGAGYGMRGNTVVKVIVSGGYITSITIVSYADDAEYFDFMKNTIIKEIISAQSTDVPIVTGATYSSIGLIDAVENALK